MFTARVRKAVADKGLTQSEELWQRFKVAKLAERPGEQEVLSQVDGCSLPRGFLSPVITSRAPKMDLVLSPRQRYKRLRR